MQPVLDAAWVQGIQPMAEGRLGEIAGLEAAAEPFRGKALAMKASAAPRRGRYTGAKARSVSTIAQPLPDLFYVHAAGGFV